MRKIGRWFGLESVAEGRPVVVVGLPSEAGVSGPPGAAEAPGAIRRWSQTAEAIDEEGRPVAGLRVEDVGDLEGAPAVIETRLAAILEARPGARLVGLGGDHGATPPILGALARQHSELALVLLDAHPDLFDTYDGRRDSHACAVARAWETPGIEPGRTALVGLRSYGRPELPAMDRAGLIVPAVEWVRRGSEEIARRVAACAEGRPVYLSLDIDVLDPASAPGTGYPVPGGPGSRELMDLMRDLWGRLDVVGLDLVEVSPPLDPGRITVATAAHLLLHAFGLWSRHGTGEA